MLQHFHSTTHDPSTNTFIIRIFGPTTEQDVIDCFQDYAQAVANNFGHRKFHIIINVDQAAHTSPAVLRRVRSSLETQNHREYIGTVVAVNENLLQPVPGDTANDPRNIPRFQNETEAIQYIRARNNMTESF